MTNKVLLATKKTNTMETEKNSQAPTSRIMERMTRFWNNATEELDSDAYASEGKTLSLTLALSTEENARICSAELNRNNSITIKIRLGSKKQHDQTEE